MFLSRNREYYYNIGLAADEWIVLLLPPATLLFPHAPAASLIAIGGILLVTRFGERRAICSRFTSLLRSPFAVATGLFFLWMGLSCLWSPAPGTSAMRFLTTLIMAATTIYLLAVATTERLYGDRSVQLMSAMALLCALLTALFIVTQMRFIGALLDLQITDRQFHRIALVLALLLPFIMAYRPFSVVLRTGLCMPLVGVIFMTTSETAKLAVLVAMASFFFAAFAWRTAIFTVAFVMVLTTLLMPLLVPLLQTAILSQLISMLPEAHAAERLAIWHEYALVIPLRLLHGWGMETSRIVLDQIDPGTLAELKIVPAPENHPHNLGLQLWLELGGIGVALFCAAIIAAFHRIYAMPAAIRTATVSVSATLFTIATIRHGAWQSWWVALVCAVLVVVVALERRERQSQGANPARARVRAG